MTHEIFQKAHELLSQGISFALATVVRREAPTSGVPGDKAIIISDGSFLGWVGGSCAQPTVLQEAQKALADGEPRLVVITPKLDDESRGGIELYSMSCYSGGAMEIYIEPYLPDPQLVVCGVSPAAAALVKIGKAVGFKTFLIDPLAEAERFPDADMILAKVEAQRLGNSRERYAVVATNGNWDEEAIKALLPLSPDYLGLVASKKRFQETIKRLSEDGIPEDQLGLIKCPAGIDISARTFPEVALSIVAEIVSIRRSEKKTARSELKAGVIKPPAMEKDPVCHMDVDPRTVQHRMDYEGTIYYFCNDHCKMSFEKDPSKYHPIGAQG